MMKRRSILAVFITAICTILFGVQAYASEPTENRRVGTGPVHLTQDDCEADSRVYTPSQTAIQMAEQSGRRVGLVRAFPNASDNETACMMMHTSVRVGPNGATKAPEGVRPGDFWVRGYSRYVTRRNGRGGYIYWLCVNDIPKLAQPTERAELAPEVLVDRRAVESVQIAPADIEVGIPTEQRRQVRTSTVIEVYDDVTVVHYPGVTRVQTTNRQVDIAPANITTRTVPVVQQYVAPEPRPCVCHRPPNDPNAVLYQYRYPDGNLYCVPRYMGEATQYPPGYGPNR